MQNHLPIGVFDSGIGGLTVAAEIQRLLPGEEILYFGDTARCPYGDREPREVVQFATQIVDFLVQEGVKLVVVACNTATAVALPILVDRYPIPVIGVIEPGARAAVSDERGDKIGVIGTAVTISTGAYERAIRKLSPVQQVFSLACPKLVPLVESGDTDGPHVDEVVESCLLPLLACDLDSLILGCTHYPLLHNSIARAMGPNVRLISSAEETAREVKRVIQMEDGWRRGGPPNHRYFTTGDPAHMATVAGRWGIGVANDVQSISQITLLAPPRVV